MCCLPGGGDETRFWGPPFAKNAGPTFIAYNRNKRSVAIDLHHEEGRQTCLELARTADVFVENFRPGTMQRFRLGYEDMKESMRAVWEAMRQSGGLDKALPGSDPKNAKDISKWFDVTLLPPFDQVAKYFGPTVYAGGWDPRGFSFKAYSPTAK